MVRHCEATVHLEELMNGTESISLASHFTLHVTLKWQFANFEPKYRRWPPAFRQDAANTGTRMTMTQYDPCPVAAAFFVVPR